MSGEGYWDWYVLKEQFPRDITSICFLLLLLLLSSFCKLWKANNIFLIYSKEKGRKRRCKFTATQPCHLTNPSFVTAPRSLLTVLLIPIGKTILFPELQWLSAAETWIGGVKFYWNNSNSHLYSQGLRWIHASHGAYISILLLLYVDLIMRSGVVLRKLSWSLTKNLTGKSKLPCCFTCLFISIFTCRWVIHDCSWFQQSSTWLKLWTPEPLVAGAQPVAMLFNGCHLPAATQLSIFINANSSW